MFQQFFLLLGVIPVLWWFAGLLQKSEAELCLASFCFKERFDLGSGLDRLIISSCWRRAGAGRGQALGVLQELEDVKRLKELCPPWQRLPGAGIPRSAPLPGCFGKLTRLALASEVALGCWTNTESSAFPELFMPRLPSPSHSPGSSQSRQMAAGAASGVLGRHKLGRVRKVGFWSCGTG